MVIRRFLINHEANLVQDDKLDIDPPLTSTEDLEQLDLCQQALLGSIEHVGVPGSGRLEYSRHVLPRHE
jgi:hypothetical protein